MIKDIINIIAIPARYPVIKKQSLLSKYKINYEEVELEAYRKNIS